jgi:large conductance mechanosensitive channel protein
MLEEFRDFLMKGNIVDLAVAFVMGVAFAAVVNSLVDNLVMPIIAMIIGKPDFSDLGATRSCSRPCRPAEGRGCSPGSTLEWSSGR